MTAVAGPITTGQGGGGRRAAAGLLALSLLWPAAAGGVAPERLAPLLARMEAKHGMDRDRLVRWLRRARVRPEILAAMRRPAERQPWHRYRRRFVDPRLAAEGQAYWRRHRRWLAAAARRYGVPPEIVLAILGVETRYGRNNGRYPVLDALVTLALHDPRRGRFFTGELEQFFLLLREEGLDPSALRGSYAGAMGIPQFIPSSYRRYAVDFDGDGRRDLMGSPADVIGSVASYLAVHGWQAGAPVAVPARLAGPPPPERVLAGLEPRLTLRHWRRWGLRPAQPLPADTRAALVRLEGEDGPVYHFGLRNFYVISRYNHSAKYAMAVFELSRLLRAGRDRGRP